MGNRANVIFKQENGYLGLYMHHGGYELRQDVARALQVVLDNNREQDVSYGTRIMVSQIIGEAWSGICSFGLNAGQTPAQAIEDNDNNDIVMIDWFEGTIAFYEAVRVLDQRVFALGNLKEKYTLSEFAQKETQIS